MLKDEDEAEMLKKLDDAEHYIKTLQDHLNNRLKRSNRLSKKDMFALNSEISEDLETDRELTQVFQSTSGVDYLNREYELRRTRERKSEFIASHKAFTLETSSYM